MKVPGWLFRDVRCEEDAEGQLRLTLALTRLGRCWYTLRAAWSILRTVRVHVYTG